MGMREWFGGLRAAVASSFHFERKHSAAWAAILQSVVPNNPVWTNERYDLLAQEGYQKQHAVFVSVGYVTTALRGIPFKVYSKNGEELTALADHPLQALLDRPNPKQTGATLREQAVGYYLLSGNLYLEGFGPTSGPNRGRYAEVYAQRPDRIQVLASGDVTDPVLGYRYEANGRQVDWPADRMLHIKTFNPLDDWYGMAPLRAAARSVDQANAAQAWNTALLQNAGRPSGAFVVKTKLGVDQRQALKDQLRDQYEGQFNAGRPILLENDADWKTMGQTPVEMDWLKGLNMTKAEIALAFGVPPEFLGIQEAKKYSNYQEARRAFYLETVLPLADMLAEELTNWLTPQYGPNLVISYDRSKIEALQDDRKVLWERASDAWEKGWVTMDEARGQVGIDPHPEHGKKFQWEVGAEKAKETQAAGVETQTSAQERLDEARHARQQEAADKGVERELDKAKRMLSGKKDEVPERKAMDVLAFELKSLSAANAEYAARQSTIGAVQAEVVARMTAEVSQLADMTSVAELEAWLDSHYALNGPAEQAWGDLTQAVWLAAGRSAGDRLLATFAPALASKGWQPPEVKANQGWLAKVLGYLSEHGANKVRDILDVTRDRIRNVLKSGVQSELSYNEIKASVESVVGDSERAWAIARTEVHAAAEVGRFEASKSVPGVETKTWNNVGDTRVRHPGSDRSPSPFDHLVVDGQTVLVDEPFEVSGEKMMHPGDTSLGASKGNTIQCRCLATYNLEEGLTA